MLLLFFKKLKYVLDKWLMKKYLVFEELNSDLFKISQSCFEGNGKKALKLSVRYILSVVAFVFGLQTL